MNKKHIYNQINMQIITRRNFLKYGTCGLGALYLRPWTYWAHQLESFPDASCLGRICVGQVDIRSKPSVDAPSIGKLYEDNVVIWLREVLGEAPGLALSHKWIETPDGYIYAPSVQMARNQPNEPVAAIPDTSMGKGMWVDVTVPYVDLYLENPPARSPWLIDSTNPRLYYSQIMWVDDLRVTSDGQTQYRVNEKYGTYGDIFWADATAFRPITEEELAPIHPGVADKRVVVDISHQVLSCYEGQDEVYFCRISSGAKYDYVGDVVDEWATPVGSYVIWRKLISIHMAGGTVSGGYDLPGIAWSCLFKGDGVAIHSTFWHNDYGTPRSHGCVNAAPDDAKWIFRWTEPNVPAIPGDLTVQQMGQSTVIEVIEP